MAKDDVEGEGLDAPILLAEWEMPLRREASLIERLSEVDQAIVRQHGHEMRLSTGEPLFRQGERHDGIVVIEDGQIRSFYVAPSGREITLAYWSKGHFVGGPDVFGGGTHMWAATAMRPSRLMFLPGAGLRRSRDRYRTSPSESSTPLSSRRAATPPSRRCWERGPSRSGSCNCSSTSPRPMA
ncbi:Crp/Fnr family transcriptional regulator [Xanthobacter sp.]|uniref:Crp/Fnr family transcriptional regulator n=1 Tax=Xanthobacter sp. TaxID=35809 RepID=UPI0025D66840|nr:cyclic nucleotide-binding domain-containing protein [Xanthobacter sp.]